MATRRERVVLELQDDFSGKMLRAAAAAEVLNKELNRLGGSSTRDRSLANMGRDAAAAERDVSRLGTASQRSSREVDKLSGRMRIMADAVAVLGPGLIPIGAVGIPAITGLASSFGFAALAGGTMIGAFQGIGGALDALNKAHLDPTKTNIDKARQAMDGLSPSARHFTRELQSIGPALDNLRKTAATDMFPGFTEGLDQMKSALPAIQRIVGAVAGELGTLGAEAGKSLGGPKWTSFFKFLADEAPQALSDMAHGTGNVAHAFAELWMAFGPLNKSFSSFLVDSTAKFDKWATALSGTDGFHEFIAYIQKSGPEVGAALGAIANALVQIVEAAAPLGGPVLAGVTGVAKALASIADSPLGTPIFTALAALALYNRGLQLTTKLTGTSFGGRAKGQLTGYADALLGVTTAQERASRSVAQGAAAQRQRMATFAKGAGQAALLGVALSGVADKAGLANTATSALIGSFVGGAAGAAVGGLAGLFLDVKHSGDEFAGTIARINAAAQTADFTAFDTGLASAKKQLDDMKHSTGPLDFLSDWKKQVGGVLSGDISFGLGGPKSPTLAKASRAGQDAKDQASLATATRAQGAALVAAANGYKLTAQGAKEAAGGLREFTAASVAANAAITKQGDYDAYRTAVLDAAKSLKSEGKALKANGDIMKTQQRAGLEQRGLLRGIASDALLAAGHMQDFGRRSKFMTRARADFIEMAQGMGLSARAAATLATTLGLVPRTVKTKVGETGAAPTTARIKSMNAEIKRLKDKRVHMDEKGAAAATARIRALIAARNALQDKTIHINVVTGHIKGVGGNPGGGSVPGGADGMTVPGQRRPYGDKVLAHLAPGEEVITNRHGEADRFRADRAAGRIPRYADGGTIKALANGGTAGYAAGAGITVYFPAPTVLQQAVKAANDIAVSSANTARSAEDTRTAHLDDLHLQQQIHETQKSLAERNDKTVGTGKHKRTLKGQGSYVLQGIDRSVAAAELADQKAQLTAMRALSSAAKDARDALISARADAATSTTGGLDLFASGSASRATRDANRYVADVAAAGQVMAQLRAAGASPILLGQIKTHVEQGDAAAAVKLGRAFLAQPALLGSLNTSLSTLSTASAATAAITTDPRFLAGGKWDPTAAAPKTVQVAVGVDPNQQTQEIVRQVVHIVRCELVGS